MKNILRKTLYIILMVTMIITSFTPYNTKADIDYDPIANKGEVKGPNEDNITVLKEIIRNDKENYFDIRLSVKTQETVNIIQYPPDDMSIVLVLDTSYSMGYCLSNGSSGCKDDLTKNRMGLLKNALVGDNGFLKNFIVSANEAKGAIRELAMVNFSNSGNVLSNFTDTDNDDNEYAKYIENVSDVGSNYKNTKFYNYFADIINSNKVKPGKDSKDGNYYTNLKDGLVKAQEVLGHAHTKNHFIIVLTDGYPTYLDSRNNRSTYYDKAAREARIQAKKIMDDYDKDPNKNITIYTIGTGLDSQSNLTYLEKENDSSNDRYAHEIGYEWEKIYTYSNNVNPSTNQPVYILDTNNKNPLTMDGNTKWTFEKVQGTNNKYYIKAENGKYLYAKYSYLSRTYKTYNLSLSDESDDKTPFTLESYNNNYRLSCNVNRTRYLTNSGTLGTNESYVFRFATNKETTTSQNKIVTPTEFKYWLGGHRMIGNSFENVGISNVPISDDWPYGGYVDGNNQEDLNAAYQKIFRAIEIEVETRKAQAWTVNDPMNAIQNESGTSMGENIEFVNFYTWIKDGYKENSSLDNKGLVKASLELVTDNDSIYKGTYRLEDSSTEKNIAYYDASKKSFVWDLKNSNPVSKNQIGNSDLYEYTYELVYRVRLKNENGVNPTNQFIEAEKYYTNGETVLYYVNTTEKEDGTIVSQDEILNIKFNIPQVRGYLGEYKFTKKSGYTGKPLEGAKFKLVLSSTNNTTYLTDEIAHINENFSITAISDSNGKVKFTNIPSGYYYDIYEIQSPEGYEEYTEENPLHIDTISVLKNNVSPNIENRTVINNPIMTALQITKIIDSKTGNVDENQEFTFSVTFTGNKPKDETFSVIDYRNKTSIKSEEKFKLKHNETITILVPYGITYKVVEDDPKNIGYEIVSGKEPTGTIEDETISVVVHNKRNNIIVKANKNWENVNDYSSIPDITFILKRYVNDVEDNDYSEERTVRSTINNGKVTTTCYNGENSQGTTCSWGSLSGDYDYKIEEIISGEDADVFSKEITKKVEGNEWTFYITNTDNRIAVLPETGSSGGLILASLAFVFITMPVMYTAYNLYIDKRWF